MIHVIQPDGTVRTETKSDLDAIQQYVGGYVEMVPNFFEYEGESCVAICNEEGRIDGLPNNVLATSLWWRQWPTCPDHLVGNIVILTGDNMREWH